MPNAQLRSDILGLSEVLKSLRDEVSDLREQRAGEQNTSRSSIHVDAGGASIWGAAWLASICCAIMLGAAFVGGFWMLDATTRATQERAELRKRDNDFQDYISVIYQVAPELQKRIEAEKAKEDQQ